ncbi:MAG: hydantoinase/oxoprolinase family protein [Planctomycetota bacterium]|nr:hydantoinase/oxoprolinase family protein [Planctomycetota bacterium]
MTPPSSKRRRPITRAATLGVDTGGTFTDLALLASDGTLTTCKVPSTPEDPSLALEAGMRAMSVQAPDAVEDCDVIHGTTVALNALLTGRTAPTALITNRGFRDLLEIGRGERPVLYDLQPQRPTPLVPRSRRYEINQRTWPNEEGDLVEVVRPTASEVARLKKTLRSSGARSLALCLLHSYADPEIETRLARALEKLGLPITCSGTLLGAHREVERFSTACANAALIPIMADYLSRLGRLLPPERLSILQSSGGTLPAERAAKEPVRVLFSGPAGGVVGAARAARQAGLGAIVTLDMGGTSTDVAFHSPEAGLSNTVHDAAVAGHPIAVPALDIHTIGCGGGSLVRVDAGGVLHVGPESAGADPGPICHGRGTEPTVTDACVHLGYIEAQGFLGGQLELDVEGVTHAFEALGQRMGVDSVLAAEAVLDLAHAAMRRALGVMTMQRGQDPSTLPLVAFGGGGGLHAAALAGSLKMPGVLIPAHPGVLSALGMASADALCDHERTVLAPLAQWSASKRKGAFSKLTGQGQAELLSAGHAARAIRFERNLALRYRGQSFELNLPEGGHLTQRFADLHRERYGWNLPGTEIELVALRARAFAPATNEAQPSAARPRKRPAPKSVVLGTRRAWFGRWHRTPLYQRSDLSPGHVISGPALIQEYSATTLIPPRHQATVGAHGHLWLTPT